MTSLGMVDVDLKEPDRHLAWIKNENREAYRKQIEEKKKQSERALHLDTLLPNVALLV